MGKRTHRILVENIPKIKIYDLKKYGFLSNEDVHILTWTYPWGKRFNAYIQLVDSGTDFSGESAQYIRTVYTYKQKVVDAQISLTTTLCHFGGERYWFECPSCSKRIGVLYKAGEYFACRTCHDLTYHTKNMNRRSHLYPYYKARQKQEKIKELLKRRFFYAGKPTKYKKEIDKLASLNCNYYAYP